MWYLLNREGLICGRHRVVRLRDWLGLWRYASGAMFGPCKCASTRHPPSPIVATNSLPWRPRVRCGRAISHFPHSHRLAHSGRVTGSVFAPRGGLGHETLSVVVEAWWMGWQQWRSPSGLRHHRDQGKQYQVSVYQRLLHRRDVTPSMSRNGNFCDNAPVESFFSSLENELVRHRYFQHQAEARYAIAEHIEVFYNRQRLRQALGYRSPKEFERQESGA